MRSMGLKEEKYRWLKRFKREREREFKNIYISRNRININCCVGLYRILMIKKRVRVSAKFETMD